MWLSEEVLQRAEKRREAKGKGEKERYTHWIEFQRKARRDKKAFLSEQWKEIEENNRMGKTRDLFKKIRDNKGIFHAKMGTTKDINNKKRWQDDTEELYKKDLHDPGNHDDVTTHLEPDIMGCKVKWALGSISMNKASGGDGIPAELFQILKDDLWKCCTQYASKFGRLSSGHTTRKGQFPFQSKKKGNAKECSNYRTIALISHARK